MSLLLRLLNSCSQATLSSVSSRLVPTACEVQSLISDFEMHHIVTEAGNRGTDRQARLIKKETCFDLFVHRLIDTSGLVPLDIASLKAKTIYSSSSAAFPV